MRYVVVEASSAGELQRKVEALLDRGWELQGGVSVATHTRAEWWYFQALVNRTAADPDDPVDHDS